MNIIKIILFSVINLLFLITLSSNLKAAENICDDFYQSIKNQGKELKLFSNPITSDTVTLFGIHWKELYDETNEIDFSSFYRNKNGYLQILEIAYDSDSYDKLYPNDLLIKINNQEIKDLSDNEISDLFENLSEINFMIERIVDNREKIVEIEVKKITYNTPTEITPAFRINAFQDINIKKSEYTINYDLDIYWSDARLMNLMKNHFIKEEGTIEELIEEKRKSNENLPEDEFAGGWWCSLNQQEFLDENLFLWHPHFKFINVVKNDLNNQTRDYLFEYFFYLDGSEEFWVTIKENGIATFTTEFDLRAFPFDSHKLEFIYADIESSLSVLNIGWHPYFSSTPLSDSIGKKLNEWKIKSKIADFENYSYYDKYDYAYSGKNTYFIIERNTSYYLYKVLAPIFLILIICWSTFWLNISEIESRLTVSIVCLLTLIAYNFVIDENIPKLSYLTIMDQIILSSYFFAALPSLFSIYYANLYNRTNIIYSKSEKFIKYYFPLFYFLVIIIILFFNISNNNSASTYMKGIFG